MILALSLGLPFALLFGAYVFLYIRAARQARRALEALCRNVGMTVGPFESSTTIRARYKEHVSMTKRLNSYAGYRHNDGD